MTNHVLPKSIRTVKNIIKYAPSLKQFARSNRKKPTKMELLLWNMVLSKCKTGYQFLRQKAIGNFILDFYCPKLLLGIEVDGASHDNKESLDWEREQTLTNMGLEILHYEDEIIKSHLESVFYDINTRLKEREEFLNKQNPSA